MKCAFVAGLALLALSAQADDMIFRQGDLSIRLTQSPCAVPHAAAAIATAIQSQVRAVEVTNGSKKVAGCWAIDDEQDVLIVTEDGRGGWIPAAAFKRAPGA